jgi:chemotaxis signal transduction protein
MKYALLFEAGQSLMAVNVGKIKQVLRKKEITPLPGAPDYLDGVVVYREKIIPVVNICKKLKKKEGNNGKERIILANIDRLLIGFKVENVLEVINVSDKDVEESEEKGLIEGTYKYKNNKIVVVIDPNRLFTDKERKVLERIQ